MRKTVIPYPTFGLNTLIFNKAIFVFLEYDRKNQYPFQRILIKSRAFFSVISHTRFYYAILKNIPYSPPALRSSMILCVFGARLFGGKLFYE